MPQEACTSRFVINRDMKFQEETTYFCEDGRKRRMLERAGSAVKHTMTFGREEADRQFSAFRPRNGKLRFIAVMRQLICVRQRCDLHIPKSLPQKALPYGGLFQRSFIGVVDRAERAAAAGGGNRAIVFDPVREGTKISSTLAIA